MKLTYKHTIYACFLGYIVQAIVNNFAPLLFLTFQRTYDIPLSQITMLVTVNFGLQLLVDLLSVGFVDRIGYRASLIIAHVCAAAGLSYDGGADCKVCVTESLLLLMRRGFSAASVQFYEDARGIDVRVRGTEGGGDTALSDEDEIALALLNALAESVCVCDADGSITFLFGSQA